MRFFTLIFVLALASPLDGQSPFTGAALPTGDARRFVMPMYADGQSAPVAVLRIERLSTEYEKRGLFRVGLLPKEVFTGVVVELDSVERLPAALANLQRLIAQSRKEHPWEMRLVRVTVRSHPSHVLAIGRLAPDGSKAWRLENVSPVRADGQARIPVTGRLHGDATLELAAPAAPVPLLAWVASEISARTTPNP